MGPIGARDSSGTQRILCSRSCSGKKKKNRHSVCICGPKVAQLDAVVKMIVFLPVSTRLMVWMVHFRIIRRG